MREKFERKIKEKKRAKSFSTVGAFNLRVLDFLITRQIDKQAGMGRGLPQSIELSRENFINLFADDDATKSLGTAYAMLVNTCSLVTFLACGKGSVKWVKLFRRKLLRFEGLASVTPTGG